MSSFKPQQCHLTIRNRTLHFVSYEGKPANLAKNEAAEPAMWYLMASGHRFPTVAWDPAQTDPEVEQSLTAWAMANAIAHGQAAAPRPRPPRKRPE